ncbi:phage tail length tape measure family protein [Limimaricola pyoseonensis]|uniref:Phage tail tape measure protein, lambda family n=1 Tax=Limimaricola pyoseonensis TaxID=521013 RepID=A0A1G7GPP4_9RHOB|nr:phage tail length tape measure family protein [Limimaricola pyoseonensis]SDE90076.1 phage tail tape measure protein, lambda family [Limimaricola pyoseonensis]
MTERRVSVRLAATGGQQLKAELVEIGQAGSRALDMIGPAANAASSGLDGVGQSSTAALQQMDALAARATRVASIMRATGVHDGSIMDRVNAATGVNAVVARDRSDIDAYGRALDDVRAKYNPLYAEIQRYRDALGGIRQAHAIGAISADEMAQAISRERQVSLASIAALKGRSGAIDQVSRASRGASLRLTQLGYQFNDVGVSIAGGMNPFVVLAQQGTQIAQIYGDGQGGVRQALRDTGSMVAGVVGRFPLLTAAIAGGTLAIAGMTAAINDGSGVAVTFGDTALATFQVVRDGLWDMVKPAWEAVVPWVEWAMDGTVNAVLFGGNLIINAFRVALASVKAAWEVLPSALGSIAISSVNAIIDALNWLIEKSIEKIRPIVDMANNVREMIGLENQPIITVGAPIEKMENPYQGAGADRGQELWGEIQGIMASDPLGTFFDAVGARARDNARRRLEDEREGSGSGGRAGKSRAAKELKEVEELDKGWGAVLGKLDEYWTGAQNIGPAVGDVLINAFKGAEAAFGEFVQTGKFGFRDLVDSMLIDLAKLSFRQNILAPAAKGISGFLGSALGNGLDILFPTNPSGTGTLGLPSFDGGGYTGSGPRSGGVDGLGGFHAILHPNELVTDLSRGQGRGDRAAPVIQISLNGAAGNAEIRDMIAAGVQEGLRTYDRAQLPQSIGRVSGRPRVNAG